MKLQNLSTRTFVRLIVEGASLTTILLLFLLYVFTKDIRVILGGFSVMILLFFWGVIFLHYFQKKLSVFTDGLCRTLDEMMDSTVRPQINYEAETLLARISHRLEAHPGREPAGTGVGTMAAQNPKLASGTWTKTDHAGNQRIWERKDSAIEPHHICAEGISIYRSQRGTG